MNAQTIFQSYSSILQCNLSYNISDSHMGISVLTGWHMIEGSSLQRQSHLHHEVLHRFHIAVAMQQGRVVAATRGGDGNHSTQK